MAKQNVNRREAQQQISREHICKRMSWRWRRAYQPIEGLAHGHRVVLSQHDVDLVADRLDVGLFERRRPKPRSFERLPPSPLLGGGFFTSFAAGQASFASDLGPPLRCKFFHASLGPTLAALAPHCSHHCADRSLVHLD